MNGVCPPVARGGMAALAAVVSGGQGWAGGGGEHQPRVGKQLQVPLAAPAVARGDHRPTTDASSASCGVASGNCPQALPTVSVTPFCKGCTAKHRGYTCTHVHLLRITPVTYYSLKP